MSTLTLHGVTIPLDGQISEVVRGHMRRSGFELHEAQAVFRLLERDDVVLELGTGCGFLAVYCAQRCAKVVTVEAAERMRQTIAAVLEANPLGERAPVVSLFGAVSRTGARRRLHPADDFWATRTSPVDPTRPGPDVAGLALSDLLETHAPSVLVIDIEGGETELAGEPLPTHVRAVVIETHEIASATACPIAAWLTAEGFTRDDFGPPWCGTWRRL